MERKQCMLTEYALSCARRDVRSSIPSEFESFEGEF